jgi:hypothetical protein
MRNMPATPTASATTSRPSQRQRSVVQWLYQSKSSRCPRKDRKSPSTGDSHRFFDFEKSK